MGSKHYQKLGKTKLVRVPEQTEVWIKQLVRELDQKENPIEVMEFISLLLGKMV